MSARLRTKLGLGIILGLAVVTASAAFYLKIGKTAKRAAPVAEFNDSTSMAVLTAAARESDARSLPQFLKRLAPPVDPAKPDAPPAPQPPLTDDQGAQWIEALNGVRTGFLRFGSYGRATAVTVAGRTIQRFSVDPGPSQWIKAIRPTHDILIAGLSDENLDVRTAALVEIGRLWSWIPGRTPTKTEEYNVATWKDSFVAPVVRRLADPEPRARAAAVSCLGYHPMDAASAPALAYLEDPKSPEVRKQVLVSFAIRATLLTEDMILRHIYDNDQSIAETAALVLKTRGLTQEQISLGSMIFHPRADIRSSVIPLLKERTDIDPVVWLIQLSQDSEESVRMNAIEALAGRKSPEVDKRLAEMAATDKSATIRKAASKLLLPEVEKTAALPPLPGSPSLNPKAN